MDLKKIKKTLNENAELIFEKLGMECESHNGNIYSPCPVHEGSDNPTAFSFSIEKGIWKCWTRDCQCECGNDIFGLITGALSAQEGRRMEFKDALKWACEALNIDRSKYKGSNNKTVETPEDDFCELVKTLQKKSKLPEEKYVTEVFKSECPSNYLYGRGFNKKTLKYFQIGDCGEKCHMKGRAVIPIHNDNGKHVVGMIGRSVKEYITPKFIFYPQGFNKRQYFYNYHRAVKTASETNCLYILEGQGDVWRMYEAGVKNAVGMLGRTITEQQQIKLKRMPVTHLIIITDNDQAGREARIQIQRQLGRMFKLTFPNLKDKDIGDMTVANIKKDILFNMKGTY